jgi:hypothetical protein
MTAHSKLLRIARTAAWIAIPALALALSTSSADAKPSGYHKNGHGHGRVVRVAGPYHAVRPVVVRPVVAYPRVYAPYRAYAPYPVYSTYSAYTPYNAYAPYRGCAAPVVTPYPVAPVPYGNVGGYVGLAGPNFSLGVAF